jgi:DNA-binding response OmpR family regulator
MTCKRILIVDDDPALTDSIARRCRDLGLEVDTARNTLTAVSILGLRPPDLVCLDVNMPTGNGLDVCEFLLRDSAAANTPVIVLTGCTSRRTISRCRALRATYVHKSTDLWQDLRPVIEELLDEEAVALVGA